MHLGVFSFSINVKDIEKSLEFYKLLGFRVLDGGHVSGEYPDTDVRKWRILENDSVMIGLFQGMVEDNILTFHPNDVFEIQNLLKSEGVSFEQEASEDGTGPPAAIVKDPDGNMIMFDQG